MNLLIGFILGPDRNSGSGGIWLVPVPVWYRYIWPVPDRYSNFFHVVFRFYDELPALRAPSSSLAGSRAPLQFPASQTVSRATLQFPDCITYSPTVPWLYHMLPSSSQTVSRATLEFTKCIMPPPPPPLWRHFIDFTLSTDISA